MLRQGDVNVLSADSKSTFPQDALASVVVFLVALPLCMGIAIASGVPPAAGLITGIIGGIVVGSLSGCPLQVSGPAAGLAVIVYDLVNRHGIEILVPTVVAAGILQLAAGFLRVGQLFRAIAPSVIYGMLAGIGILIFGAQFHVMVDDQPRDNGLANLISIPQAVMKGIWPADGSSHHLAAMIGITTIAVVLLWTKLAPKRLKWVPGALVAVVLATFAAQVARMDIRYVDLPESLIGALRLPDYGLFGRLLETEILVAAVALAFIASAETLLSATAVDQMHDGPRTRYNKELVSQGVGNMLSGFAGGLPMTGVIVRSATNVAAGAKTRRSAIMHGCWLLILVAAAPSLLRMVPTASLAAILVYTGYKLVNPQNIRRLLKYGGPPVVIYAATVIVIVSVDLLAGILTGIALSLAKIVYALSRMDIEVNGGDRRVEVHVKGAATFIRLPKLLDTLEKLPADREVHLHIDKLEYIDHACMDALDSWEQKRNGANGTGCKTVVEWDELREKYRLRNRIVGANGKAQEVAAAGS
ncbi:MAG: SulP family inorganic anion transporter [Bryobacteraceae bacterium]|nr:SulP family inorganic anion transporter [Bryobacteraceae bacterium]